MKRCPECGIEIEDDSQVFCPTCSCKLEEVKIENGFSFENPFSSSSSSYTTSSSSSSSSSYSSSYNGRKKGGCLKKFILFLLFVALVVGIVQLIKNVKRPPKGSEPYEEKVYEIGDWGEAGVVFYDKGYYSDGWRYLECSAGYIKGQPWESENSYQEFELSEEFGEGARNTYKIVDKCGSNTAAHIVTDFLSRDKGDWYLGTTREMSTLFMNLVDNKKIRKKVEKYDGFEKLYTTLGDAMKSEKTLTYLTSNMANSEECYVVVFSTGLGYGGGEKRSIGKDWTSYKNGYNISHTVRIRPIRKF